MFEDEAILGFQALLEMEANAAAGSRVASTCIVLSLVGLHKGTPIASLLPRGRCLDKASG